MHKNSNSVINYNKVIQNVDCSIPQISCKPSFKLPCFYKKAKDDDIIDDMMAIDGHDDLDDSYPHNSFVLEELPDNL